MVLITAVLALAPFIIALTSFYFVTKSVAADLHAGMTSLTVGISLATAGYCFGALLGGDFILRFPQRPLFLVCEGLFVGGATLGAAATTGAMLAGGSILMGFATGLLLVVALPPLIQRFPPARLRYTSIFVNLGFFGALTAGPLLGGALSTGSLWRVIYGAVAGVAAVNWGLAYFTLPVRKPLNPGFPFDWPAIALGLLGTFLTFWGAAEAQGQGLGSPLFIGPIAAGALCLLALLVIEYRKRMALSPVRPLSSTIPVTGIAIAMTGGGALFAFLLLAARFMISIQGASALSAGLAFWPMLAGTLATAGLLGLVYRSRFILVLPFAGMLLLVAAGSVMLALTPGSGRGLILAANGLLGMGAGATVAPGLFITGYSTDAKIIGRVFALVELVRSEADFILAPVLIEIGIIYSAGSDLSFEGFRVATWISLVIAILSIVVAAGVYLAGGMQLPRPDVTRWLEQRGTAFESPPLGGAWRRRA
jgi:MFS family permease